jgi:phospholipid transport system substrate-binding protein
MLRSVAAVRGVSMLLVFAGAGLCTPPVHAQDAPDALVRRVVQEILRSVEQDAALRAGDRASAERLIEDKIAPHFDFMRMTRLAVGRNWREATPEQRQQLNEAFRRLLIRTYAAAFRGYRSTTVDVKPLALQPQDDDVVVRTQVRWAEAPEPLAIDYSMFRSDRGWKVYDVTVGGVSMITTYRSNFADQIRQGGIEGLLHALADPRRTEIPPELKGKN